MYRDRAAWRCAFFVGKKIEAKDIHKEMLPMYGELACHVRQSIIGCRSSRKGGQVSKTNIEAVGRWFRQQLKEFYAAGFQGLVKRWDKCLNLYGDYVEK